MNTHSRKVYSVVADMMIQMIAKIGAIPWTVKLSSNLISDSLIMQGGLVIEKDNGEYRFYFVGFNHNERNIVCSCVKGGIKSEEELKSQLDSVLVGWAKQFIKLHKTTPETIILYF